MMLQRIAEFIQSNQLIRKGDIVCAGLSGGADSVCMTVLLNALKKELGFELKAFHVNHHLRGEASDADELFVRKFCEANGIDLTVFHHQVSEAALQMNCGTEEAGRILRREDAMECLKNGCSRIALAHHKNDQAETLLFNLTRGSSLSGLAGIRPAAGPFIHPMLCFKREEILSFLDEQNIEWRTDASNEDIRFKRNYIRHRILPLLIAEVNDKAIDHLASAAEDMSHIEKIMDQVSDHAISRHTLIFDDSVRIRSSLTEEDPFIVREVIFKCIQKLSGRNRDVSRKHLDLAAHLFGRQTGTAFSLPFGLTASADYGDVLLQLRKQTEYCEVPFIPGDTIRIKDTLITSRFIKDPTEIILQKNKYTKCFDYDKIGDSCVIRTRKPGDLIVIDANGGTKKLKDYFIDSKISRSERDTVLLLAAGNTVHWVIGCRMGESAKVTEQTARSIVISAEEAGKNEY